MNPNNPTSTPSSSLSGSGAQRGAGTTESSKNEAAETKRSVGDTARHAAQEAKQSAAGVFDQAKEKVSHLAEEQRETMAHRIGSYSSAIRDSAKSIENDDPNIAHYANEAADRIERVANYVREVDVSSLRRDAESLARRHPAVFMGGMFVAGLVLGNLVKASAQAATSDSGYDDGYAGEDDEMYRPAGYGTASSGVGTYPAGTGLGGESGGGLGQTGGGSLGQSGGASGQMGSTPGLPGTAPYGRPETGI